MQPRILSAQLDPALEEQLAIWCQRQLEIGRNEVLELEEAIKGNKKVKLSAAQFVWKCHVLYRAWVAVISILHILELFI